MKVSFNKLNRNIRRLIDIVGHRADENNFEAFLVGGVVRDILLARPSIDMDVVVLGSGITLAEKISKELNTKLTVHEQFLTTSQMYKGIRLDISTARTEKYPQPGWSGPRWRSRWRAARRTRSPGGWCVPPNRLRLRRYRRPGGAAPRLRGSSGPPTACQCPGAPPTDPDY